MIAIFFESDCTSRAEPGELHNLKVFACFKSTVLGRLFKPFLNKEKRKTDFIMKYLNLKNS